MLYFRIEYTLDYYCSKTFRFTFNENVQKLTLIDSYATRSVTLDYSDISSTESFSIKINNESLDIFVICCINEQFIFFINNPKLFYKALDGTCDNVATSPCSSSAINTFNRILSTAKLPSGTYVIQSSTSKLEQNIAKIKNICGNTP